MARPGSRRSSASEVVVIMWRDIPAQINGKVGEERHQVMLPHRFQKAIDRAAMVAGKKTAQEYVGEWRRTNHPLVGDLVETVDATAATIEARVHQRAPAHPRRQRRLGPGIARPARRHARQHDSTNDGHLMTHTVISSATKEVVIGFDRPFVMIGERINPTGRKLLAEEMKNGDFSRVEADALAQVAAGAHMLDVNAGIPLADEPALLARAIQLVQSITDVPLSIDSSIIEALEAGLAVYQGKPLVNSVTGEDEQMERVLPLVAKYGAAVVAISNDETGISDRPRRALRSRPQDRQPRQPTTASPPATSWSTRW